MNIFILDENPILAAQMHCDQHLHKMILESAQMVSTAFHLNALDKLPIGSIPEVYRPAYVNHPCTKWTCESLENILWVCQLGLELENIRIRSGYQPHKSAAILWGVYKLIFSNGSYNYNNHTPFVTAMPLTIAIRTCSVVQKYQTYYRYKYAEWLDSGRRMTYKHNPTPSFMSDLITD